MKGIQALYFIIFFSLNLNVVKSQDLIKSGTTKEFNTKKWIKSIVNLECTSNFKDRYAGTAIFFLYEKRHYLLTARHVIADLYHIDSNKIFNQIYLVQNKDNYTPAEITKVRETFYSVKNQPPFLFNYDNFYLLSSEALDIGLLDLENSFYGIQFVLWLYERGYVPVEVQDFDTSNNIKLNQDIYTVGFPKESYYKNVTNSQQQAGLEASINSLPVITRGRVKSFEKKSFLFESEIFVYHGYSGGPILCNNKIIGINSRIMVVKIINPTDSSQSYIELRPTMIKAKYLFTLLSQYQSKIETLRKTNPELFRNLDHLRAKYPKLR